MTKREWPERAAVVAYIRDRAEQYADDSGSKCALEELLGPIASGEHAHLASCGEYDDLQADKYVRLAAATAHSPSDAQPCGHPRSAIVSSDEGTHYCGECEREAKAGEERRCGPTCHHWRQIDRNFGCALVVTGRRESVRWINCPDWAPRKGEG